MASIPIGLQLYSVRDDCEKDLPGTLKQVAEMGYVGVEFAGYHDYSAQELRKMLDDVGLKCCGTHIDLDTMLGDELPRTAEFNKILGNKFLIAPSLSKEHRGSRAAWLEAAKVFNEVAAKTKEFGMRVGYHNHTHEFAEMDGETPWDIFFGNTVDEVVMQLDTGNAMHGGGDSVAILERYPGRATTVHLKEFSAAENALVGEGDIDWQKVFDVCESVGDTEWYIVEQESYAYPPLECVARCLDNLRKMGK